MLTVCCSMLKTRINYKPLLMRSFSVSAMNLKGISLSSHPYVYAHQDKSKEGYAISYVSTDDIKGKSITSTPDVIIGWTTEKDHVDPKTFVENQRFVGFMSKVFRKNIHQVDDATLKALAEWQKEGWLHIGDERNPPPWGRINFPEDIIGSVQLEKGKIKEDTYEPMPTHRMVTNDGLFKISEPLTQCIINAAKKYVSNA